MPLDFETNAVSISFLTLSGQCLSLRSLFNISCTNVKMSLLATSSWIETWTGFNSSKASVPSKCCRLMTSNRKSAVSQDLISPINCTSSSGLEHSSRASTATIALALFVNIARRTTFKLSVDGSCLLSRLHVYRFDKSCGISVRLTVNCIMRDRTNESSVRLSASLKSK